MGQNPEKEVSGKQTIEFIRRFTRVCQVDPLLKDTPDSYSLN